jgi:hypothetical protein
MTMGCRRFRRGVRAWTPRAESEAMESASTFRKRRLPGVDR